MGLNGFNGLKFLYAIFRDVFIVSRIAECLIIVGILFIPGATPVGNRFYSPTGCPNVDIATELSNNKIIGI